LPDKSLGAFVRPLNGSMMFRVSAGARLQTGARKWQPCAPLLARSQRGLIPLIAMTDSCGRPAIPSDLRLCSHRRDDSRSGIDMKELKIRKDRTPAVLRKLAKDETDARVPRRILAIANALSGMNRAEAASSAGMDRQTLRDWVIRYNAHGVAGSSIAGPGVGLLSSTRRNRSSCSRSC